MPRPKKTATTLARTPRRRSPAFERPNSIVASAARIVGKRKDRPLGTGPEDWQLESWGFFDTCPELAAATSWITNSMSQVKLRLVVEDEQGNLETVPEDATDGYARLALDAMAALFDGDAGQSQMMADLATHLSVPGECFLIGLPPNDADGDLGRDQWRVVSNEELKETAPGAGRWELDRGDGVIEKLIVPRDDLPAGTPDGWTTGEGQEALIIRIWRSHPRKHVLATSPVRAALPVLRTLRGLEMHTASGIDSRLAGAGILLVPSEMTFQTPNVDGQPITDGMVDDFLASLAEAMSAAMRDQGSPAARVPIVVKAPGAFLSAVQHITFENKMDDNTEAKTEGNIRRLALALDIPPEELLGKGDVNHWGGWLVSEDGVKLHVDPLADLIAFALITRYLWPAMQGPSRVMDPAIKRYRLLPDTSDLRQRNLDIGQAMDLHTRMVISDAALLRETRFDPADAPDEDERKRRFTELVASGAPGPEVVAAAIEYVTGGIVKAPEVISPPVEGSPPPQLGPQGTPRTTQAPEEAPRAEPQQATLTALTACGELAVSRAVERAWNRAGKRGTERRPVEAQKLDACLAGAWTAVPGVAQKLGVDPVRLEAAFDRYARGLLSTGAAHNEAIFTRMLAEQVLAEPARELVPVA